MGRPYLLIKVTCDRESLYNYIIGGTSWKDPEKDVHKKWDYSYQKHEYGITFPEYLEYALSRKKDYKFLWQYRRLDQWTDPNLIGTFKDGFIIEYILRAAAYINVKNALRRCARNRELNSKFSVVDGDVLEFFLTNHPVLVDAINRVLYASRVVVDAGYKWDNYPWSSVNRGVDSIYSQDYVDKASKRCTVAGHSPNPISVRNDLCEDLCDGIYEAIYGRKPCESDYAYHLRTSTFGQLELPLTW
jgi:hypothetical protein